MGKRIIAADASAAPVFIKRGVAVTSSREVARVFGKRHKDVLRDIAALDCSSGFNRRNFAPIEYTDGRNRKQPECLMTKDGFTFLVMGYRGRKAAAFKERYIARFNDMERLLIERRGEEWRTARRAGTVARNGETAAISQLVAYAKAQDSRHADKLYVVYTRLAGKAAGVADRDAAGAAQLLNLRLCEDVIGKVILRGMAAAKHYKEIYQDCKAQMALCRAALLLGDDLGAPALPALPAA